MISPPQSVEQLIKAARECSPADRSAFLDRACPNSPEVRRLVEQRLVEEGDRGGAMDGARPDLATLTSPLPGGAGLTNAGRFSPGQVIAGRFTVVRYIDRGGMGEVYEAADRFLQGVHVALKMILPEIAGDAGSSHRFEQEVLLARKVTHPNLCPIYDIARSDDPPPPFLFLTMKLLIGETLSSRLRRQSLPIPRAEAIAIFRQMVAGVAAIHAAQVIHRDIKPNNVMLDSSGPELCLSIMDFGLARLHVEDATMPARSMVAGTPGYMAPEILHGQGPSQATDLYALGVLLHQVLTGDRPHFGAISLAAESSPALDTADVPPVLIHTVKEFLAKDPKRRCVAFEQVQSAFVSSDPNTAWQWDTVPRASLLSRRKFAVGSAVAACAAAGGIAWKWESLSDLLHPLPGKRFVALVGWPAPADAHLQAMIASVVDAIGSELARAEAFDRDLLILPHTIGNNVSSLAQLNQLRESLGANLVLAASGVPQSGGLHLLLRLLDPATSRTLRQKAVNVPLDEQLQLPERAVRTAAELLGITRYKPDDQRSKVGTGNAEAYTAFEAAEALMKQENDSGLDAAIEKYKQAIEIDPRYAMAQARLSWAYLRSYALHGDAAALRLASLNCRSAIQLDPNLVDAHLGLASVSQRTGDFQNASREMSRALSLDPSNPHTLIYQARFYAASGHWEDSEATFARVLKMRPNYWLAHNELGVILDQQGKYSQALMEFRSASLAAPRNALAFYNIGSVYLDQGNLTQAVDNFKTSFALEPNEESATGLAAVSRIGRRHAEAIGYAQTAVKLDPSEPGAQLELGDVYSAAANRRDALLAYRQAALIQEEQLRTQTRNGHGWMLLALCRVKAGQPATASALIAKADMLNAGDMDSQLMKVRTLELLGRRDDALATIAHCLSKGASVFQFQSMPDLESLRTDPRYREVIRSSASATEQAV